MQHSPLSAKLLVIPVCPSRRYALERTVVSVAFGVICIFEQVFQAEGLFVSLRRHGPVEVQQLAISKAGDAEGGGRVWLERWKSKSRGNGPTLHCCYCTLGVKGCALRRLLIGPVWEPEWREEQTAGDRTALSLRIRRCTQKNNRYPIPRSCPIQSLDAADAILLYVPPRTLLPRWFPSAWNRTTRVGCVSQRSRLCLCDRGHESRHRAGHHSAHRRD
jgi:hypothetical protein